MNDCVFLVVLRRPTADPTEMRSDPFWEFGSFGCTFCHNHNLLNPCREASSETCGTRKQPVTKPGHPTAIGVSLIVAEEREEIQFYEITSAVKGYGSRMVGAVLNALPKSWRVYVLMDWSDGFWKVMRRRHRRIVVM